MRTTIIYKDKNGNINDFDTNEYCFKNEKSKQFREIQKHLNEETRKKKNILKNNNLKKTQQLQEPKNKQKQFKNISKKNNNLKKEIKNKKQTIKSNINKQRKINNFLSKWEEVMTFTKLFNDFHHTFSHDNLQITSYGFKSTIIIPLGFSCNHLVNIKDILQNNLQCTIVFKTYPNKNYINAKFIYIENCNQIDFTPYKVKPYEVFIGVDESGEPILIDINIEPHILIAGATRSGKNGTLDHSIASFIYSCNENEINLHLIQGAKGDLSKYRNCKQVKSFCYKDEESKIINLINNIRKELKLRRELFAKITDDFESPNLKRYNELYPNNQLPYIYIIVDEIMTLAENAVSGNKKLYKTDIEFMSLLKSIAEYGAAYGITYILSHQKPEAKLMPTFVKNMSNVRICYSVPDAICSEITLGQGKFEALNLPPRKAYVRSMRYEGYLYTLDLTNNIKKYVENSIVKNKDIKTSNNSIDTSNNSSIFKSKSILKTKNDYINDKLSIEENRNLKINNGIEILKNKNEKSKCVEIDNLKIKKIQSVKNDFSKVTPKSKEEILQENINKIDGWIPYNPIKKGDNNNDN